MPFPDTVQVHTTAKGKQMGERNNASAFTVGPVESFCGIHDEARTLTRQVERTVEGRWSQDWQNLANLSLSGALVAAIPAHESGSAFPTHSYCAHRVEQTALLQYN